MPAEMILSEKKKSMYRPRPLKKPINTAIKLFYCNYLYTTVIPTFSRPYATVIQYFFTHRQRKYQKKTNKKKLKSFNTTTMFTYLFNSPE